MVLGNDKSNILSGIKHKVRIVFTEGTAMCLRWIWYPEENPEWDLAQWITKIYTNKLLKWVSIRQRRYYGRM